MIKLKNNKKGFSLIELIVVIAIMVVMLMVLVPSLLRYVEKSRMQRDDSAMSEVVQCTKIAINKTEVYDECFDYAASGNFTGYIDSDGKVTGKRDEERWAPSGSGKTLTITFNPDENGFYSMEKARVNDMGQQKTQQTQQTRQKARGRISTNTGKIKKCNFEDMGNKYLYNSLKTSIGEQLKSVSATYRHSSYTLFIVFNDGNVSTYGEWNGTNLSDDSDSATVNPGGSDVTVPSEPDNKDDKKDEDIPIIPVPGNKEDAKDETKVEGCATFTDGVTLTWEELKQAENGTKYSYNASKISDTSIGSNAFDTCARLKNITIPDSVTSIGDYAFRNCAYLTNVTIPNGVTSIGREAFYTCSSLTSINIPDSVTSIGDYAFQFCKSLTSVNIPDSVTSIGREAFHFCIRVKSITISNSITSIRNETFYGCSGLTNVTIPNGVTSIGDGAFDGCNSITNVTIPDSVTKIGSYAFFKCSSLTSITFTGTKAQWNAITKGSNWNAKTGKYTIHYTDT